MNGTLRTIDGRNTLHFERHLHHPVEKVWRALTVADDLRQWFPAAIEGARAVGAPLRFVFAGDAVPPTEGAITAFEPPKLFEFTWGGELLRWELHPDAAGCVLHFTHTFKDRAGAASFAAGWHGCLDALGALLAGTPGTIMSPDWVARHEVYTAQFGLATGTTERTADGWLVRFERQLTAPVDTVWAALTATGEQSAAPISLTSGDAPPLRATNGYIPAGSLTAISAPTLLEYQWLDDGAPAGLVRWALSNGPGGARLLLTQTLPEALATQRPLFLAAWQTHLELFTDHLKGIERCPWPTERTEELRRQYAEALG
jgi:uncharacterized protein YndB with AHSA1/START domain